MATTPQTESNQINTMSDHIASDSHQYLTFIMAGEEYGVGILCVQEIRGWDSATPLPKAPAHIKGVINLRGTIVPIIDLQQCFGLEPTKLTPTTVVIVLKINVPQSNGSDSRTIGILVDAVSDVYTVNPGDLKQAPNLGGTIDTDYIEGLVEVDNSMVVLLKIEQLMSLEDLPDLSQLHSQINPVND